MSFIRNISATIAGALLLTSQAVAEEFPSRNIEIIFPWGPGTAMAAVQVIAEGMGNELGVSLPVVSNPGAAGVRAVQTGLDRKADGYTIIDNWVAPLVLQPILGNADWAAKDFIPLWSGVTVPFAIAVRKDDDRFPDFPSFVEHVKNNPGEVRYSSGSFGNLPHMIMAQTMRANNAFARNIPYQQDGDALKDLRAGVIDYMFVSPATYASNSDAFKAIVVLNDDAGVRKYFDDAPLAGDFGTNIGLSGLAPMGWHWFTLHPDTPADRVKVLSDAMEKTLNNPEVIKRLESLNFFVPKLPPQDFEASVTNVREQLTAAADAVEWERAQLGQ